VILCVLDFVSYTIFNFSFYFFLPFFSSFSSFSLCIFSPFLILLFLFLFSFSFFVPVFSAIIAEYALMAPTICRGLLAITASRSNFPADIVFCNRKEMRKHNINSSKENKEKEMHMSQLG
jgi:hypothetical protein